MAKEHKARAAQYFNEYEFRWEDGWVVSKNGKDLVLVEFLKNEVKFTLNELLERYKLTSRPNGWNTETCYEMLTKHLTTGLYPQTFFLRVWLDQWVLSILPVYWNLVYDNERKVVGDYKAGDLAHEFVLTIEKRYL